MKRSLIFLTSTNSHGPDGRNARSQERVENAQDTTRQRPGGTFGAFRVREAKSDELDETFHSISNPRKRKKATTAPIKAMMKAHCTSGLAIPLPVPSLHQDFAYNVQAVLAAARLHIREWTANIARTKPSRLPDALRCRQWAFADVTHRSLLLTPELRDAILCVDAKLRSCISSEHLSKAEVLSKYDIALRSLQAALLDSDPARLQSILATTQLLALWEMLDYSRDRSWSKHLAGTLMLAKFRLARKSLSFRDDSLYDEEVHAQAGPMFVELVLANKDAVHPSERTQWQTFVCSTMAEQSMSIRQHRELIGALIRAATLVVQADSYNASRLDPMTRYTMLGHAYEVKDDLRRSTVECEGIFASAATKSTPLDVLGMCLATLLSLDRVIRTYQPFRGDGNEAEQATVDLCERLLHLDLTSSRGAG